MREAFRRIACIFAFAALILLATSARAGDDTARFYGTWKTTVVLNGQTVTVISVHDASGYKNFAQTPTGNDARGRRNVHGGERQVVLERSRFPTMAASITF